MRCEDKGSTPVSRSSETLERLSILLFRDGRGRDVRDDVGGRGVELLLRGARIAFRNGVGPASRELDEKSSSEYPRIENMITNDPPRTTFC